MMSATKFCVVGPGYPFRGGIAKYTTALSLELQNQGLLNQFFTPTRQYPSWLFPGKSDLDNEACPRLTQSEACFDYFNPFSWHFLSQKLAVFSHSCLVLPFWSSASIPLNYYLIQRHQGMKVAIVHNWKDHERFLGLISFERIIFKCDGMICHQDSPLIYEEVSGKAKKAVIYPLPPIPWEGDLQDSTEARKLLNIPQKNRVFLFWGLIRPYKGLNDILTAFEKLSPHLNATLVVAGEIWGQGSELRSRLENLSKTHSCRFKLEWIQEKEIPIWFSAADVVVTPYHSGSGSAVVIQARKFKKPLIATQHAVGTPPVPGCENIEPGNVQQLQRAFERFLDETYFQSKQAEANSFTGSSWTSYIEQLKKMVHEEMRG